MDQRGAVTRPRTGADPLAPLTVQEAWQRSLPGGAVARAGCTARIML